MRQAGGDRFSTEPGRLRGARPWESGRAGNAVMPTGVTRTNSGRLLSTTERRLRPLI